VRLRAGANDGNLLATDLAVYLVGKGVPFREAHEAVGKAVRRAGDLGVDLAALGLGELRSVHSAFDDVAEVLDVERSVRKRLR
jgi:argininosuccinate lyase